MNQQKLIIITGSPCVGKTTVTEKLFESYENSAHFDGDWMKLVQAVYVWVWKRTAKGTSARLQV
ncbi:MAG: hypothetical protein IKK33_02255 [Lachnospiraceae bacterium]|nr:hypothetical protein [Lachnospiraceae bacterium]